jgi:hypothetical protein
MDPLSVLRQFTIANEPIAEDEKHYIFGTRKFAKDEPTAYKSQAGKGD